MTNIPSNLDDLGTPLSVVTHTIDEFKVVITKYHCSCMRVQLYNCNELYKDDFAQCPYHGNYTPKGVLPEELGWFGVTPKKPKKVRNKSK